MTDVACLPSGDDRPVHAGAAGGRGHLSDSSGHCLGSADQGKLTRDPTPPDPRLRSPPPAVSSPGGYTHFPANLGGSACISELVQAISAVRHFDGRSGMIRRPEFRNWLHFYRIPCRLSINWSQKGVLPINVCPGRRQCPGGHGCHDIGRWQLAAVDDTSTFNVLTFKEIHAELKD